MKKIFNHSNLKTIDNKEWLLTNGIGGYSFFSLPLSPNRKHHALLIASLHPPVNRNVILSTIDEYIKNHNTTYNLVNRQHSHYDINNTQHIKEIMIDNVVHYHYEINRLKIDKTISLQYHHNTIAIAYHIENNELATEFTIKPVLNIRDHNETTKEKKPYMCVHHEHEASIIALHQKNIQVKIYCSDGSFKTENTYIEDIHYPIDQKLGTSCLDTGYIPYSITIPLSSNEVKDISLIVSIEDNYQKDAFKIIEDEISRRNQLINTNDETLETLIKISDQFIVKREKFNGKSIIAGYPWFSDWGRGTLIAFTGLTLVTKRYKDAKNILRTYAKSLHKGIVVNLFDDRDNTPTYHTVDASLWFINCCYQYVKYTGDYQYLKKTIYPAMKEIIVWYIKGTENNIYLDDDFLIHAGNENTHLTWMNVKVNDIPMTPRFGKPVEINALWYNSLKIMESLARVFNEDDSTFALLANKCKESFNQKFYNPDTACLYDVIEPNDASIRPNQLFALSLSFPIVEKRYEEEIFTTITKHLYTGRGIRSLSNQDPNYHAVYQGNIEKRDEQYHQGIAHGYLIGAYITCHYKIYKNKKLSLQLLTPILDSLNDGCINAISELFDGDEPHDSKGAIHYAMSVAEILRMYDKLIK